MQSCGIKAYKENNYQYGIDWEFEGNTDRIIKKWCNKNDTSIDDMKLYCINYLGNATIADKTAYYFALHKKRLDIKVIVFGCRAIKKIGRIICRK